jgi:hypothetical protein
MLEHYKNPPIIGVTHFFAEAIATEEQRKQREKELICAHRKPIWCSTPAKRKTVQVRSSTQARKNYGSNHCRPENKGLGPATGGIVAVQGFHEVSRAEGPK